MKFIPERLEVAVGQTVTWTNRDFVPHSVTAPGIESGDLAENANWSWTAKQKGEIAYICRLHPVMKGVVVVK
jgi:plastocyanin